MKDVLLILALTIICSIGTDAKRYEANKDGINYLITYDKVNWHRAFQTCKQSGMELVSINTNKEHQNIKQVIEESGLNILNENFWTGGTDLGKEGEFFWASTGRVFKDSSTGVGTGFWHRYQPDNYRQREHCVDLRIWDSKLVKGTLLNDNECHVPSYFICTSTDRNRDEERDITRDIARDVARDIARDISRDRARDLEIEQKLANCRKS